MPTHEIITAVGEVHSRLRRETRYSDPTAIADALIGDPSSSLYGEVRETILREPAGEHLFPHVPETLQTILQNRDDIVIWTQGKVQNQIWKVATAGLGKLLPKDERHRLSVSAAEDKVGALSSLLEKEEADTVIFVDDKLSMLTAAKSLMKNYPHLSAHYIVVNHKTPKNEPEMEGADPPFIKISDIAQLQTIKAELQIYDRAHWYIDFGDTLVDTDSLRRATITSLATIVEKREPIISPAIDLLAGLPGHVASTKNLTTEVHGKRVIDITAPDGHEMIIKSADTPEKTIREIKGYELLKDTPLAKHIAFPFATSTSPAFLVLPKLRGIQMREGIRTEELEGVTGLHVLQELLEIKKEWWATQKKQDPQQSGIVSHQRTNWPRNLERIATVIADMSKTTGIPIEAFGSSPIVSSGHTLPPLRDSVMQVHHLLTDQPPYTVLTHGDAMGGNILVEPDTGIWHIFDPEYTGYNDPAEAYVKTIKYVTTATAQGMQKLALKYEGDSLYIDVSVKFSPLAYRLQEYGLSQVDEFAKALDDSDFPRRVKKYFIASYLREIALTLRRNRPEMAWFALVQAQKITAGLIQEAA